MTLRTLQAPIITHAGISAARAVVVGFERLSVVKKTSLPEPVDGVAGTSDITQRVFGEVSYGG